ncbi:hypothetical protein ACM46_04270 [Chryseobacterium angstadtii]|uniref:Uncharacterized protein n=1 Tax=Chryseobacterium angstadtii TaxID=558151 RepID=A0A0J7LCT7_9FLAO|nr:hypothetical protein [Chryseobacterium angstadtii]KMQ66730.1 hypothetical protein ACM46_04270 [Chryseobacterium angstadtii]
MKKKIILILSIILSGSVYSQVGINTPNPQGVLHVDAAKDNPSTGTPTTAQQLNDFVVTSSGNVGIGTNTPSEKIDIQGNIRVRSALDGSNVTNFPNAVVMRTDGTLGYTKASNISLQSFQLIIPVHNTFVADFNNHTNTAYDSDNWWVIQKTSFVPVSNRSPARMTITYEYQGAPFSDTSKIFPTMTAGNNSGYSDLFAVSFVSLQNVSGKTRLTVSISRVDNFVSEWGASFLLNVFFAIKS